ncbi:alpha/beta hydrolase [Streptomyces spongiae]|uniref:Alpha/beta hydrolase n=1 Tax=Streptomyces spongiae TaxID=565072 RepID=A0A5N8XKH7_9ACTN|nr:alpha/beta hydrolase [Streptomyces spongiae]MPY59498.1 alpha/beta hydrolase [Streptomyces spongiae]
MHIRSCPGLPSSGTTTHGRPDRGNRPLRTTTGFLLASALLVSACSLSGSTSAASTTGATATGATAKGATAKPGVPVLNALTGATPSALTPYYGQKLTWRNCDDPGFECATMKAPLDYAKPAAGDIRLAVSRKKATGPGKRLGSLLVNPGGPGGSAVRYLQSYAGITYPATVRARYDMVALDPRGVAGSEPVECLTGRRMDAYTQTDFTPDDRRETAQLVDAFKRFANGCAEQSPRLLRHVSTVEAARDMDILRTALGDKRLTYVGASYGTFLGATYAGLFPERVGRLVLDGGMDPSLSARKLNEGQTAGFETAFRSFAKDCVRQLDCPLGDTDASPAQLGRNLAAFFARLDAKPIPAGDSGGRPLGESLATTGVVAAMYNEQTWPRLRQALTRAIDHRDGSGLLALSDGYYERGADGEYANLISANSAVNCLDFPSAFSTPEQARRALPAFEKASPVFGRFLTWASLGCAYWPVKPTGTPHRIEAKGAAPIVVVGTTRDPATPYHWAQALASQLSSGRLLTYDGDGHTAYGRGSECIDSAINTYLLDGTPPTHGKRCSQP